VRALALSGSTLYVGGWFTSIGGAARTQIAALNMSTGRATAWNPTANTSAPCESEKCPPDFGVLALAVSGSNVYAGGYFTSIGGRPRNHLAALNTTTGAATTWNPNLRGPNNYFDYSFVDALAVSGSTVYAGGRSTSIGGRPRNNLAALDAVTARATGSNPDADGNVLALAASGATVYVGGSFRSIGGAARRNIAALDATTGRARRWKSNASGDVAALAVSGSRVYAGGEFSSSGGRSRHSLASLDATTGQATAWNPNITGSIQALAVSGSTVYAGGTFSSVGRYQQQGFAVFPPLP
jgi:hypothetical protein